MYKHVVYDDDDDDDDDIIVWHFGFKTSRFRNFSIFWMVSVSVSKNFGIEKSIGIGFENFWYRKKYRYRFRKKMVSEKSFGFGFVQILGFVTHWFIYDNQYIKMIMF